MSDAVACVFIWPLWAPFAWQPGELTNEPEHLARSARIARALDEGVASIAKTPMASLLTREAADTILSEVERAERRLHELDAMLARPELDLGRAVRRAEASGATRGSARLHLESVAQLRKMRSADARALEELEDLVTALSSQLALTRFTGSSHEGPDGIVTQVWAKVEGLAGALTLTQAATHESHEEALFDDPRTAVHATQNEVHHGA